ncbi:MAG: type II secretion system F family protein [Planctomycetota bacterium]|jgi:type II secretory pathway component PulF
MPHFHYTATDSSGKSVEGHIEANDHANARELLAEQGLAAEQIAEVDHPGPGREQQLPGPSGLSGRDQIEVIGQMGAMMDAGLPLSVGLRTLAEEVSESSKGCLLTMSTRLDEGESLDNVIHAAAGALPEWLRQMLHSGAESHTLTQSVQHYVRFTRLRHSLSGQVAAALAYPAILTFVSLAICCGLLALVIPQFRTLFEEFGMELPAITQMMIGLSDACVWVLQNFLAVGAASVILVGLVTFLFWIVAGPATVRRAVYELPLIGKTIKLRSLCEFCHLLALLIENRIPLPRALALVGTATTDPCLSQCAHDAARYVEQGESLASLRHLIPQMPPELLRIPGWDSPDESLPQSLRASSDIFAAQCGVTARAMAGAATPVLITVVGCGVAITVMGMFMPLIKLLNDLS